MAITMDEYDLTKKNLMQSPWAQEGFVYVAQLVSDGYTFSDSHATRADVGYFVGAPVELQNRSIEEDSGFTCVNSDNIEFSSTLDAAYCVIHQMFTGSPLSTDKLVFCLTLNGGEMESVSSAIQLDFGDFACINRV